MPFWVPSHRPWSVPFWSLGRSPETSRLAIGSTGSGKTEGELVELVRLARRGDCAVVLLDGHGPLALRAAGHWVGRGNEHRLVYEPLDATERALCWSMLPGSNAATVSQRRIEDAETRDEVAQCFLAQRGLSTLSDRPWTKEWLEAAIGLCLAQPREEPLTSLLAAFRVGSPDYERLLAGCDQAEIVGKFYAMERLRRRNEVQYEMQTGASRRLLEPVCSSEVVRLHSRPGPFSWLQALQDRKLIVFDGGGLSSREIKRTLFLLVSLQVIHAVRRHFALTRQALPVVLVLEEAGALGLVTPFVLTALQELRKAGLAIHLITQSSLDFGDQSLFELVLANTPWQAWYQCLSPADQELGAKVLANATFDPLAVHYTRTRLVHDGFRPVSAESRGDSFDPQSHRSRQDSRTATAFLTRYKESVEPYFKTPQLHEQVYRTRLATLRLGERMVRDRGGVRRELVRPVRTPWLHPISDASTQACIARIRQQPIYLPPPPDREIPPPAPLPDAAERLRTRGGQTPAR